MLLPYEKETTITFNNEEKIAYVYTCNDVWVRRLDGYCKEYPDQYKLYRQDEYSKTYTVPKKYIKIGKPSTRKGNADALRRHRERQSL
jgi:hypothetical protein